MYSVGNTVNNNVYGCMVPDGNRLIVVIIL